MQNKITSSGKVNNLNCNENLEETYELTQEHHWVLLTLLKQVDQSIERAILISMYNAKFKKTTSDFNILRDELLNKKLIGEIPTLGEGFRDATMWYLTPEGLKLAKEKYKSNTEKVG